MFQGSSFKISPLNIALCTALFSHVAIANTDETVVVTGNPLQAADVTIDASQLEKSQASDLNDIFRTSSEVSVGGGTDYSQKVYVRGLEDTMLNVTIDGAVQAGSLFHHQGSLFIEPELLEQVDVSAGAGRATDGAGALGGAIKMKTKDPRALLEAGEQFGGRVKTTYSDNTDGFKTSATGYGALSDKVTVLASLGYTEQDDYEDGNGDTAEYTGFRNKFGFAKIVGELTDAQTLTFSYERKEDDATRYARPHMGDFSRNYPLLQSTYRDTATLNYLLDSGSTWLNLDTTFYYTDLNLERFNDPRFGTYIGNTESIGGDIRNTSTFEQLTLIYGTDFRRDESTFSGGNQTFVDKGDQVGVYLQGDYSLTQSMMLSAGARYDHYALDEDLRDGDSRSEGTDISDSGFSPNVAATYFITEDVNVILGYAEAFRGPQVSELWLLDYAYSANDRKGETAKNTELTVNWSFDNGYLSATVFDSKIEDVVDRESSIFENVGTLDNQGFTVSAGYQLESVAATISYSRAEPELNGVPLSDGNMNIGTATGDTLVTTVNYFATDDLEFGWTGRFVDRLTDVPDGSEEKPGYGVHDLYAQWMPISGEDLALTASVKNVFDKAYRDQASLSEDFNGTFEPGRNIKLGVNWGF
ncbi:TonB-dependent receptor domain-containing protein [Enterovibrio norvegicus]|uniref:TonB-dependent receptor domain-containing protein n=1 Tax=Enterovibrio norvegicus TaxID=188144 RepID=UPI000C84891B|nr:TonB-dependent receptor [Enterovibrio norvegicus]PML76949.1 enterobactin receptor VctA [Enterovibrio norvegicus]